MTLADSISLSPALFTVFAGFHFLFMLDGGVNHVKFRHKVVTTSGTAMINFAAWKAFTTEPPVAEK